MILSFNKMLIGLLGMEIVGALGFLTCSTLGFEFLDLRVNGIQLEEKEVLEVLPKFLLYIAW